MSYQHGRKFPTPGITDPQRKGEAKDDYIARIMYAVQHDLSDEELLSCVREIRDVDRDVEIAAEKEVRQL